MKNTFKRITALLISAILMLSVLTACGETATLLPFIARDPEKIDLDGYVFSYIQTNGMYEDTFGYKATTVLNDAVMKRISDIESALNCDISAGTNTYSSDVLFSKYISGDVGFEAMYATNDNQSLMGAASYGILMPVEDYGDYIDYLNTEKYGAANIVEANSYKGSIYGVTPLYWVHNEPVSIGLVCFNMGLVDKYGKTAPREFYENDEWTWDTMERIISDYYVIDGDNTVYSLAARSIDLLKLAAMGNGVKYADVEPDGSAMKTLFSEKMSEACDWYNHLVSEYYNHFALAMDTHIYSWAHVSEHFSFIQDSMACITSPNVLFNTIVYEVKKYSLLPFPSGPKGVYGEWPAVLEGASTFSVFGTAKEPELAFKIIDMLAEPFDDYKTQDQIIDYLTTNVLYSREDTEIVLASKENGQYTYWPQGIGFIGSLYVDLVDETLTSTHTEVLERNKLILESYLNEYVLPNMAIYDLYE